MTKEIIISTELGRGKTFNLSLEWILGFFEGDGSFNIQLKPTAHHKTGYSVILIFEIHQSAIDVDTLRAIQNYFGVGKVEIGRKVKKDSPQTWVWRLRISSQKELFEGLIPILNKQSMVLNKRQNDLIIFLEVCEIVKNKEHTTFEGQKLILEKAACLYSRLKSKELLKDSYKSLNPAWVLGFVEAEGNFSVWLPNKLETSSQSVEVKFRFSIDQEISESRVLNLLPQFFGLPQDKQKEDLPTTEKSSKSYVYTNTDNKMAHFVVNNRKDIKNVIIPFFDSQLQNFGTVKKKQSYLRFKAAFEYWEANRPLSSVKKVKLDEILSHKE